SGGTALPRAVATDGACGNIWHNSKVEEATREGPMQGKIALEEHFAIPETLEDSHGYFPDRVWQEGKSRVMDNHERRLREIDDNGMELMLLSLNAPGVQAIPDKARATEIARKANDYLAEQVARRPSRFQGLAALPMQDPEGAARELERCVKELGFRG